MPTLLDDRQVENRAALSAIGSVANTTLDSIFNSINTIFADATYLPTASVLMKRDANANVQANNFINNLTTTSTAAGTTTLTVGSAYFQQFTGTTTQTVVLPDATTMAAGQAFFIINRSTGNVTVEMNGGSTLQILTANSQAIVTLITNGTSAGTWDVAYTVTGPLPFLQTQLTTDSTTTGSASTLQASDIDYGVVRLTNASLSSISGIPAGSGGQQIIIENKTGNSINVKNDDSGASVGNRIYTGTNGPVSMLNNASFTLIYDNVSNYWMIVGGTGSGSGSGTGKNYLSAIVTSQSSTPNPGNGDFELGSTAGWSLGNVATLTNGFPSGTPTFGSGSSAFLAISTVSSGQLAGNYSLSYVNSSSGSDIPGDFLASDPFYIDTEDQGKILNISFSYKIVSGGAGMNFSGTSSSSFGIAIYDVTNSAWIQATSVWPVTQSSGVGNAIASFQATSNSTQYRLVFYNNVAVSNAFTINFDSFSVSPQSEFIGAVVTDLDSYTPTVSTGAFTFSDLKASRVGSGLNLSFTAQSTTVGSGVYEFSLPPGLSFDSSVALTTVANGVSTQSINTILGFASAGTGGATLGGSGVVVATSTTTFAVVLLSAASSTFSTSTNSYTDRAIGYGSASPFNSVGHYLSLRITNAPIQGWSSQMQLNPPVGSPVVAFSAYGSTTNINNTTATVIYPTVQSDTSGSYDSSTGIWTSKISGWVFVEGSAQTDPYTLATNSWDTLFIAVNGSSQKSYLQAGNGASSAKSFHVSKAIPVIAGDTIKIQFNTTANVTLDGTHGNEFSISMIPPMVATYNPSIRMRYTDTSGQSVGTSATKLSFATKSFDTTSGSWDGSTFTVAESGKYRVKSKVVINTTNLNATMYAYLNGSEYSEIGYTPALSGINARCSGDDEIDCIAGDTISVYLSSNGSTSLDSASGLNYVIIEKVG